MSETIIQLRRDTQSKWNAVNPVLATGEIGIETDTKKCKFGKNGLQWDEIIYGGTSHPQQLSEFLVL